MFDGRKDGEGGRGGRTATALASRRSSLIGVYVVPIGPIWSSVGFVGMFDAATGGEAAGVKRAAGFNVVGFNVMGFNVVSGVRHRTKQ